MSERPILFSAPMIRALLDGRKTQTRRAMTPQPTDEGLGLSWGPGKHRRMGWAYSAREAGKPHPDWLAQCPYGVPGDQLWVREAWRYINHQTGPRGLEVCVGYEADGESLPNRPSYLVADEWADKVDAWPYRPRRRPSIHMPRWASRITLRITDVRVERLQDISEVDALAEGIERIRFPEVGEWGWPQRKYREIWEHINGPGSWDVNPFVWVVSFEAELPE